MPGSIEKRGVNSWRIMISDGYRPDGTKRRIYKTLKYSPSMSESAQRKECEKELALLYAQVKGGAVVSGRQYTLSEFAQLWMRDYIATAGLSPVTVRGYEFLLQNKLLPELGHVKLQQLSPQLLTRFYGKLANEHVVGNRGRGQQVTANTVLHYHGLLRCILNTAVKWGVLANNPALKASVPRLDAKPVTPLDDEQSRELLTALSKAPVKYRAGVVVGLLGQLRKGEIGGLNWTDLDPETGLLHVERSAVYVSGHGVLLKETKTQAGRRELYLPRYALDILEELRAEQEAEKALAGEAWVESGAMFTQKNGKRQHPDTISKWFREFLADNNLPAIRFHDLRHTGASLLIASGEDIETLKERLGHSKASITMDVYGHAYKKKDRQAAERLDGLFLTQ